MKGLRRNCSVSMILIYDWACLPYRRAIGEKTSRRSRLHISLARSRTYISLLRTNLNATANTCAHVRIACSIACLPPQFIPGGGGVYLRILRFAPSGNILLTPFLTRTHSHTRTRENAHRHTSHTQTVPRSLSLSLTAKYIYNNILRPKNKLYYVLPAN